MALIYNNWIFYLPTSAELEAEFELEPVMCSTTRNVGEKKTNNINISTLMCSVFLSVNVKTPDTTYIPLPLCVSYFL